jgi:hypothetical protein
MPIKISCQCGQSFQAPDHLAGKKVRCPKCGNPLAIPAANQPSTAGQQPAGRDAIGGLLDDMGVESTPSGGKRCPNCNAVMAGHAVFCIECGLDLQTQEVVTSTNSHQQSDSDQPTTKSYGNPVLDKAAKELEYDKREKRVSQDPRSWYTYFIGLMFLAVFITVGAIVSLKAEAKRDKIESDLPEPMEAIFYGTLAIGLMVIVYPWGQITYTGFKKGGALHGLLCLTLIYAPVCCFMFWKDLKRAFGMWIFGFLLLGLSLFIQTKIGDEVGGAEQEVAGAAILGGGLVMVVFIAFLIGISFLALASGWVLNTKAGKPGWTSLVPILNGFEFIDMAGRPAWWFFLLLIPGLNIAVAILLCINLAENFGKGTGFGLGLAFLGFIFFPILAFGDSVYQPVSR